MKAVILAGGFGTRLSQFIKGIPKSMAPIGDKPFLALLIECLRDQAIREIILSVYYRSECIIDYFGDSYEGIPIHYSIEPEPLGTGGAIKYVLQQGNFQSPLFFINGDTYLQLNYQAMWKQHMQKQANLTLALQQVEDTARYGCVVVRGEQIQAFQEKGIKKNGLINAGVYLIEPSIINIFPLQRHFSFEKDILQLQFKMLRPSFILTKGYFIDIGIPEDYIKFNQDLARENNNAL